jgi:hypothetical protein
VLAEAVKVPGLLKTCNPEKPPPATAAVLCVVASLKVISVPLTDIGMSFS